ncbi:MAG: SLC13 family permease [Rikenellaceae bacterium]
MVYFILMPIIFLIATLCVAFEEKLHINKAAIVITSAVILWAMLFIGADSILGAGYSEEFNTLFERLKIEHNSKIDIYFAFLSKFALIQHLGDVATTLFFIIGSMLIIEIVDSHGGFRIITDKITTRNKRTMMALICTITFFMSALLNDMATAILMVAILRKFILNRDDRIVFCSMVIIAANAGGSWSPIGDVTTILLWTSGNLSPAHQISHLFIPSLFCMAIPVTISMFYFKKGETFEELTTTEKDLIVSMLPRRVRNTILAMGVASLALVPLFNEFTGLPPFMGVMFGVALLWIYTDLLYKNMKRVDADMRRDVSRLLPKIDMSSIMFFFGILMSVAALNTAGELTIAADYLNKVVDDPRIISIILGVCSSFLDNVALVASAIGMYPLQAAGAEGLLSNFVVNSQFWTLMAFCCVTGGSILIVGSATGVSVMGLEKISFGYYLKKFTPLAIIGYISGILIFFLLN